MMIVEIAVQTVMLNGQIRLQKGVVVEILECLVMYRLTKTETLLVLKPGQGPGRRDHIFAINCTYQVL